MHYLPLAHGASGIFDELILGAEGFLLLILIIAFFRSRGRKPQPAAGKPVPEESTPAEEIKQ